MTARFRSAFLLAALTQLPVTAQASCPTRADLREGITLVQNGDHFIRSDFELTAQGLREVRIERDESGERQRVIIFGHGLVPLGFSEGRDITRIIPGEDPARLDGLPAAGSMVTNGKLVEPDGTPRAFQLVHVFAATNDVSILGCDYDTWEITETFVIDGQIEGERQVVYTPDLGVILATQDYAYSWIGTAADVAR